MVLVTVLDIVVIVPRPFFGVAAAFRPLLFFFVFVVVVNFFLYDMLRSSNSV